MPRDLAPTGSDGKSALDRIADLDALWTCPGCGTRVWFKGTPGASRCHCARRTQYVPRLAVAVRTLYPTARPKHSVAWDDPSRPRSSSPPGDQLAVVAHVRLGIGPGAGIPLPAYLRGRVDKACPRVASTPAAPTPVPVILRAELVSPYAVILRAF